MSGVLLSSASSEFARKVRIACDDDLTVIRPDQLPAGPAQLLALAREPAQVATVVLDVRDGNGLVDHAIDLASRIDQHHGGVGVILVSCDAEGLALKALRAGVRDVIGPESSVADIRWALRRAEDGRAASQGNGAPGDHYGGRVITVASPKGGVGKTTVSTNLALALASQSPSGVVLVDLDAQFGDVAAALNLAPTYTIGDIVEGPALADPIAVKTLLTQHESGMHVVPGVATPVEAESLGAQKIGQLIQVLRQQFRYVVIDTAPGMSEHTLVAMDHTTDIILVTGMDVPGVRGLRKELELLDQLEIAPFNRHVVLNNEDRASGLKIADIEAAIRRKVDLVIPRSPTVARSTNVGSPIVEMAPRDRISRDLVALAQRLAPTSTKGSSRRKRGERQ